MFLTWLILIAIRSFKIASQSTLHTVLVKVLLRSAEIVFYQTITEKHSHFREQFGDLSYQTSFILMLVGWNSSVRVKQQNTFECLGSGLYYVQT